METPSTSETHGPRALNVLYRGLVWAFVGALYAAMFVPVFEITANVLPQWVAPIFATIAATAGGALVYSSSQLAIQTAIFSNIAVFGFLLVGGITVPPLGPTLVGAVVGAFTGAMYGLIVKESRIYRAEAKLIAGIAAGGVVSVVGLVWVLVIDGKLIWLIATLAPISGALYLRLLDTFLQRFSDLLPPVGDGAAAGLVIGGFIGFGLWLMAGVALEQVLPDWRDTFNRIVETAPGAIGAASLTTFLLGTTKAAFGLHWGDPYDQ